ncbi:MAG: HRDC domain-containing protein [Propionibacteriaceae bacterium]|nr:HRDC domain-containing protein [Propionibacterium sp.]MDO4644362.1 HRDC domain-containing protein [Propionibacteriaceae bacterium]
MSDFVEQSREPLRPVVETSGHFDECLSALSTATGPVAFDAERAHGHRYWPKAYLFQIRRQGAGTWLIDPIALEQAPARLSDLVSACSDAPWVIHAASQDLPCMTEVGVRPPYLFDTELSARLLGEPSVGLAALLEAKLGIRLRKAHSAANWATRPLPTSWLIYAALDVDYLIELADVLNTELTASGRLSWAREEFAYTLDLFTTPSAPRKEPWRRLSGLQGLRHPVQLAVARALWQEREAIAQQKDRPPSRILPDAAIVGIASKADKESPLPDAPTLAGVPGFRSRNAGRYRAHWSRALESVSRMSPDDYPQRRPEATGIPQPRSWERSHPDRWVFWKKARAAVDALAGELGIQPSLVISSATLSTCIYEWEEGQDFREALAGLGVRDWQVEFLVPLLNKCLQDG